MESPTAYGKLRRDMQQAIASAMYMQLSADAPSQDRELQHLMMQLTRALNHHRKYLRFLQHEHSRDLLFVREDHERP
jgi:hypothetical protein